MQYQRLGLSHLGRALLDQGFAATPTSTHNIACKPLPYVFAPLGLLTQLGCAPPGCRDLSQRPCVRPHDLASVSLISRPVSNTNTEAIILRAADPTMKACSPFHVPSNAEMVPAMNMGLA